MRIQHNISAMNAYRNFNTNNSKLTKNLEKLSTGYKINRAGDDAAGLAISEKMRAQITGLEGATKNAKDGISLIQTAEGALTEVHDMLNRMVTLTEQSANGTYDDTLDRAQLQKEVEALKSEIDRVADSTNYNGIKLLDGSLSGAGNLGGDVRANDSVATMNTAETDAFTQLDLSSGGKTLTGGDTLTYSMTWNDKAGEHKLNVKLTVTDDLKYLKSEDGTTYGLASTNGTKIEAAEIASAVMGELQKSTELTNSFDVKAGATSTLAIAFDSKVKGSDGGVITSADTTAKIANAPTDIAFGADDLNRTMGVDQVQKLDLTSIKVLTKAIVDASGDQEKMIEDNTFSVDGRKFIMIGNGESHDDFKKLVDSETTIIKFGTQAGGSNWAGNTEDAADVKMLAAELSRVTGKDFHSVTSTEETNWDGSGLKENDLIFRDKVVKLSKGGKELTLQVGDTSDKWNQVGVKVADMHVDALGLTDVDISNQEGAQTAVSVIKNAVNLVSDTRGGLGALQNRLDHTINNLGVMRENIQSAEGLIRDTDVAEEMTTYTKNNILNQAAQAMLAQANQLPQGVLQLLG